MQFNGNTCRLDWRVQGGCAVGVAVSSLDTVSVCGNVMTAAMHTDYGVTIPLSDVGSPIDSFMSDIFDASPGMSYMLTHLYAGAAGTALVQSNRIIEGKFDALFSIVCSAALSPVSDNVTAVTAGIVLMANIMSHCRAVDISFAAFSGQNISVFMSESLGGPACPYVVTPGTWGEGRGLSISGP